jgi:hypothetical protein
VTAEPVGKAGAREILEEILEEILDPPLRLATAHLPGVERQWSQIGAVDYEPSCVPYSKESPTASAGHV